MVEGSDHLIWIRTDPFYPIYFCPFGSVVEHQSCKLEVASSILAGGCLYNVIRFAKSYCRI